MLLRLTVGLLAVMGALLFAAGDSEVSRTDLAALREERQRMVQLPPVTPPEATAHAGPVSDTGAAQSAPPAPAEDGLPDDAPADAPPPGTPELDAPQTVTDAPESASGETDADASDAPAPDTEDAAVILVVTGSVVNVRSGPSTDTAVVTQVEAGDLVELVSRAADGWARIRVEGVAEDVYMSADFLSEPQ